VLDRVVDNFFAETEQVAFCTQNVPPGIDFSDDPLLQGRNFSYLDTQLKRLGGPNFTHLPINAPRCPFANFQQDGHMAFFNPKGRVNYEPNSWGAEGGPRESPQRGFRSFAAAAEGPKARLRPESFADHYSQARQFYVSQTPIEQKHIGDALTFELSKVERPDIRARIVSHLINIDDALAATVANGLGLPALPAPAKAARPTREDLAPSPALSIVERGPGSFAGRKLGILLTDGADAKLFDALVRAAAEADAVTEVVAPKIAGAVLSDGKLVPAKQKIDGGPSVLFDAVAVLASAEGAALLARDGAAKDFVNDAFGHCKFIAYSAEALALFEKVGLAADLDDGCFALSDLKGARRFIAAAGQLRHWPRELKVDLDAAA
jgi:catalase